MHISFTPALGDRLSVPCEPSGLLSLSATIQFFATLSASDSAELKRAGAKVQVWTNIGSSPGEWGEHDFQDEILDMQDSVHHAGDPAELVHLIGKEEEDRHTAEYDDRSGCLRLRIPIPAGTWSRSEASSFEFTYRIVYPSGDIKWLGYYGHNGTIMLESGKAGRMALDSQDGWSLNNSDDSCIYYNLPEGHSDEIRVARFADLSSYQLWAFGNDELLPHCKGASLVLMTPRGPTLRTLIIPHIYVLSASSGASVSVDYSGNITACGNGTITLYTYTYGSQASARELVSWISTLYLQDTYCAVHIISSGKDYALLAPISVVKKTPYKALVLPLNFTPTNQIVGIPLTILSDMFGIDSSAPLTILSQNNLDAYFFQPQASTGPVPDIDTVVTFLVDPSGSQFSVGSARILSSSGKNNERDTTVEWSASVLCPFSYIEPSHVDDAGTVLPTPPPSPPLNSEELPLRISRTASVDSLGSKEPPRSDVDTVDGSSTTGRHGSGDRALDTLVKHSHVMPAKSGLLAYIKHVFMITGIILGLLYRMFFRKVQVVAESDDEGNDGVLKNPSPSHAPGELKEMSPSLTSPGTANLAASNPGANDSLEDDLLPSVIDTSPEKHEAFTHSKTKDSPVREEGIQSKTDSRSLPSSLETSSSFRVQIDETSNIIVALKLRVSSLASNVDCTVSPPPDTSEILKSISVNGIAPQDCKIKKREVNGNASVMEHIYLLEFEGRVGDWLNLSPPTVGVDP